VVWKKQIYGFEQKRFTTKKKTSFLSLISSLMFANKLNTRNAEDMLNGDRNYGNGSLP
jgi:hypothetical protein